MKKEVVLLWMVALSVPLYETLVSSSEKLFNQFKENVNGHEHVAWFTLLHSLQYTIIFQ